VVALLFRAGDQLPVILFKEVVGNGLSIPPAQIGGTLLKVGVIFVATFTTVVVEQPLLST
jgi:hypothetical protein